MVTSSFIGRFPIGRMSICLGNGGYLTWIAWCTRVQIATDNTVCSAYTLVLPLTTPLCFHDCCMPMCCWCIDNKKLDNSGQTCAGGYYGPLLQHLSTGPSVNFSVWALYYSWCDAGNKLFSYINPVCLHWQSTSPCCSRDPVTPKDLTQPDLSNTAPIKLTLHRLSCYNF